MMEEVTYKLPSDIERESMRIIGEDLNQQAVTRERSTAAVVIRVSHTTAYLY